MKEIPKVLLIGAGKFGKNYLRILQEFQAEGLINFVGVAVASQESANKLKSEISVPVYCDVNDEILQKADTFIIATPPETHFGLVSQCLKFGHVMVEKPVTQSLDELGKLALLEKETGNSVMVGQLFRFHPLTKILLEMVAEQKKESSIKKIECVFINDEASDQRREVSFELLHWFDFVGTYFGLDTVKDFYVGAKEARAINIQTRLEDVDVRYSLGWVGDSRKRYITFAFQSGIKISADFLTNTLKIYKDDSTVDTIGVEGDALKTEVTAFLSFIKGETPNPVPLSSVRYCIDFAEKVVLNKSKIRSNDSKPRVAVIGAGLFGCNVALELSPFCDVTLFEKNDDILLEASFVNQTRHHLGYHYPRSSETVKDIQTSAPLFESIYEEAIVRNLPTYYAIAKDGSNVTPEEFINFCDVHGLPYEVEDIPDGLIDKDFISLSIKVPEPIYHYPKVKELTKQLLSKSSSIKINLNHLVVGASLLDNGKKRLQISNTTGRYAEEFDFVVNTTYAKMNTFAGWMGFMPHPVRIDVAEVLAVSLPISPVAVTIMDGPFGGFLPSGNTNEFILYHAKASIIDRYTPKDGMVVERKALKSQSIYLYEECLKLFPILEKATWLETRVAYRGVLAFHEHDDARVADVVDHGFGCWSVLSGKIQSSVQTARKIKAAIEKELV